MKNIFSSIVCILLTISAIAQEPFFTVKKITHSNSDYEFPIFSSKTHSNAAQKINTYLQITELQLLEQGVKNHLFEAISPIEDIKPYGTYDLDYEIISNNEKLLTLKIRKTTCGASCHYPYYYYSFNPQNGDVLLIQDLIKPEVWNEFRTMVWEKRRDRLEKSLIKWEQQQDETINEVPDMYNYLFVNYEKEVLREFFIHEDSIFIDGFSQFRKGDLWIDVEMTTSFDLSEFQFYLNDYGKILFGLKSGNIGDYRSSSIDQVYYGKLGENLEIIFTLKNWSDDFVNGYSTYKKYGQAIELDIEKSGNQLDIIEYRDDTKYATMRLTIIGTTLKGTWQNANKTKSYPILLKRE